ncbi:MULTISPECIES: iron ABC transporter ATP-binding protein [unclassified Romboutsia]|uniref:iron ABC transporter ATP-binding protein n=1 Tax=unclassified Romboutsia TaxID=2626894 RepID=UPI0008220062|nr:MULTISPECIES: ATP-binding cassette domain-containing protein [unclassified Romboutsia]SCH31932.1 Probable siderophore transport system ATP-binding protein YusV [uncultured Clostridium sp.]
MIEIKNILKKYKDRNVVDNVSFNIEKGKITSFIGPNGAGKSTVLGIVTRLISGDGGEVVIEGKNLSDYHTKELAKKIAILKQSNNISLKLTIRELVGFGRFPHSQGNLNAEDEKYIDEAIEYMKLTDIQDKYLDELSGGQRQRAYIAMVIAQNTEYILLDEPLNNLDMSHSVQMMKVLRNLCDDLGKTIVLVMHDINFASCYSDNIVALKNGRIEKVGKTEEIVQKEVLEDIYEMNFDIKEINGNKICVYF